MATLIRDTVPWGRNLAEYTSMFGLAPDDLRGRILDCGSGPASFNAEATAACASVTSCDPLYQFTHDEIAGRIDEVVPLLLDEMHLNHHTFVWDTLISPENVVAIRMAAMKAFLADYDAGKAAGRYLEASLPELPLASDSFDLALSSHFLFLYSEALSLEFHIAAIEEMLRVAREVRVYPVMGMGGVPTPHAEPVIAAMTECGFVAEHVATPYEFQRGAREYLRVWRR